MPCYQPLQGWYACDGEERGRVMFSRQPGVMYIETPLPCGKCVGCRMEQARQWAVRCMHEAELHEDNCMVTLTYSDDNPCYDGELHPDDTCLWLKRLRKAFPNKKIRYFLAGEYGEKFKRPHYHVLIFGLDFQQGLDYNVNDDRPHISDLQDTWTYGFVQVSPLTFESAAYVARYCLKKQTSEIDYCDRSTGVIRHPEFTRMSRMPGIGAGWIAQNHADTYCDDSVIAGGNKRRPPRYYDRRYEKTQGEGALKEIKAERILQASLRSADNTPERLRVREKIMKSGLALKKRGYENG